MSFMVQKKINEVVIQLGFNNIYWIKTFLFVWLILKTLMLSGCKSLLESR